MYFFKKIPNINSIRNDLKFKHYDINNLNWDKLSYQEFEVMQAITKYHCENGPKLIHHFEDLHKSAKKDLVDTKKGDDINSLIEGNKRALEKKGASQLRLKGEEIKIKMFDKLFVYPSFYAYQKFYESILTSLPKILDKLVQKGVLLETNLQHPMDLKINANLEYPVYRDGKVVSVLNTALDYPVCKNEDDLKEVYQEIKSAIDNTENNVRTKISKLGIAINGTAVNKGEVKENYDNLHSFEEFYQSIVETPKSSISMSR